MRRSHLALSFVAPLLGLLLLSPGADAATNPSAESRLVGLLNGDRAARGLPALSVRGDLVSAARRHAARMAAAGAVFHNGGLSGEVGGWELLGENVAATPDTDTGHAGLMASAAHRANILSTQFTEVGVGVEEVDGVLWIVQVFRRPVAAAAPAPAPPPPTPAPPAGQDPTPSSTG